MWRRRCGEGCAEGAAEATCPAGTARLGGGIRLRAAVPPLVKGFCRQLAGKSAKAKVAVFALLRDIVAALQGGARPSAGPTRAADRADQGRR